MGTRSGQPVTTGHGQAHSDLLVLPRFSLLRAPTQIFNMFFHFLDFRFRKAIQIEVGMGFFLYERRERFSRRNGIIRLSVEKIRRHFENISCFGDEIIVYPFFLSGLNPGEDRVVDAQFFRQLDLGPLSFLAQPFDSLSNNRHRFTNFPFWQGYCSSFPKRKKLV